MQAAGFFAQAARDAKVDTIVNMSQILARPEAVSHASLNQWIAERVFDWSNLGVTHLRPTIFAEWLLYYAQVINTNSMLALPFRGPNKVALVAAEDQARVIAGILEDPQPHRGKTYSLYGAVEMTWTEIVAEMSRVLGRDIKYQPMEVEIFDQYARSVGFSDFTIQHVSGGGSPDFENGLFTGNNDIVTRVGGKEPMTITEFVERHATAFSVGS